MIETDAMGDIGNNGKIIGEWRSIPCMVADAISGLEDDGLDRRGSEDSLTIRESVHHIAEANLVAAGIVVAARGAPGCVVDWSWMMPFGEWVSRLGYASMPVEPGLDLMRALNAFVVRVVSRPEALDAPVSLIDARDRPPRAVTVRDILRQECDHAREHVGRIERTRTACGI